VRSDTVPEGGGGVRWVERKWVKKECVGGVTKDVVEDV